MSFSLLPLDIVNEVPQEFDLKEKRMYSVLNGPQEFTAKTFTTQSYSTTSMSFTADPPSENDIIYPVFWKEVEFSVSALLTNTDAAHSYYGFTFSETNAVGKDISHFLVPRAFPLSQIIATESVSLNGAQFTTNLNEYNNAFIRYCNDIHDRSGKYSLAPSMLDELHLYSDADLTFRDPFARYSDSFIRDSRSAFSGNNYAASDAEIIANGAPKTLTFTFKVSEPCFVSPFWYQKKGITQIKSLSYNAVFSDINRAVSLGVIKAVDPTKYAISNIAVSITSAKLKFYYATPKLLDKIPKQLTYAYQEIQVYKTTAAGLAAGASVDVVAPSINLSAIPRRVIIWAEENRQDRQGNAVAIVGKTDTLKAAITAINLSFGNRSGLFSSASQQDLYYIAKKNGLDMTYSQYSKYVGSVLALDFGRDIGLPTDLSVGTLANPQFGVTVSIKNVSAATVNFEVKYAIIYDGCMTIVNGSVNRQLGILSQNDVLEAQLKSQEIVSDEQCENLFGGRIAGNPLALLGMLPGIISGIRKGVQVGAPIAKGVADFAEKIGLGYPDRDQDNGEMDYRDRMLQQKKPMKKPVKKAGKVMSRGDLVSGLYQQDYEL